MSPGLARRRVLASCRRICFWNWMGVIEVRARKWRWKEVTLIAASAARSSTRRGEMRKEGMIGHIGLSNVTAGQLRAAQQITEIAAVTAYFNVAARHEAALLDATVGTGAVFCPWQPVSLTQPGAATDTSGPQTIRRVLDPIAARHGATIPQVTLAWLLARSPDRKSTRLNSSHGYISYAVFCLKKKKKLPSLFILQKQQQNIRRRPNT